MRPPRYSAEEVQDYLGRQRASGLSLAAFCRQHGLPYDRLVFWRRKLHGPTRPRRVASPNFLPVHVKPAAPNHEEVPQRQPPDEGPAMVVTLRGGRAIRVAANFDGGALRRLIEVVEATAC